MKRWSAVSEAKAYARAEAQHGLLAWTELEKLGLSRRTLHRRIRAGLWRRAGRNVYRLLPSKQGNYHQTLMAMCLSLGPDAYVSHAAAARLHKLDGNKGEETTEFTILKAHSGRAKAGDTIHRASYARSENVTRVDGIPCTSLSRTLLDVSGQWTSDAADAAVDCALRNPKVATAKWLRLFLNKMKARGVRGVRALRALLDGRGNSKPFDSESERWFVKRVLAPNGLPKPVHNFPLYDENGKLKWKVDCVWEQFGIGVELQSRKHHTGAEAVRRDNDKQNDMILAGLKPFKFWREDIKRDPGPIVRMLREAMEHALN